MGAPAVKQAQATARHYAFEKVLETLPGFASLMRRRSMAELQLYAGYVWAREGGKGKCPVIRAKPVGDQSYFLPGVIHLSPRHRNVATLLHELAHALGTHDKLDHGPAFRKRCVRLYREYGEWDGAITWEER